MAKAEVQEGKRRVWTIMTTHMRRMGDGQMSGILGYVRGPDLEEPIEVVPLSVAEALADALARIAQFYVCGWPDDPGDQERIGDIADEALAAYRKARPADQLRKEGT
jgi:hypothetical protein